VTNTATCLIERTPLRIGPHQVWPPVVLAPMAGVTNAPFRDLCRAEGAGLYVSEMVAARGLVEGHDKTHRLARFGPGETPRSIQLYGVDPAVMGEAVRRLVGDLGAEHVDLNFGCPVRKVTRHGGGSALPWRRRLFADVVRAAVQGAGDVPVTVKLRLGIDDDHLTYLDAGPIAEAEGAAAVALHARTAEAAYSGSARWAAIGELKARVTSVPVLGNGDVWLAADALRMVAETGCDGVVVGRGCLGRPWLFGDLAAAFGARPAPFLRENRSPGSQSSRKNRSSPVLEGDVIAHRPELPQEPTTARSAARADVRPGDRSWDSAPPVGGVAAAMGDHARRLVEWHGDTVGVRDLRKHVGWYLQGYPVGPAARRRLVEADSLEQFQARLDELDPSVELPPESVGLPRGHQHGPRPVTVPEGFWHDRDDPTPLGAAADALTSGG
jgi:nifR3 family TIM-barrel protein